MTTIKDLTQDTESNKILNILSKSKSAFVPFHTRCLIKKEYPQIMFTAGPCQENDFVIITHESSEIDAVKKHLNKNAKILDPYDVTKAIKDDRPAHEGDKDIVEPPFFHNGFQYGEICYHSEVSGGLMYLCPSPKENGMSYLVDNSKPCGIVHLCHDEEIKNHRQSDAKLELNARRLFEKFNDCLSKATQKKTTSRSYLDFYELPHSSRAAWIEFAKEFEINEKAPS